MIVRISGEDQYRLDDGLHDQLDQLAGVAHVAVDVDDEAAFSRSLGELLAFVRTNGTLVGDEEIETSDVILPPSDTTLAEARSEFTGEGLIPD
ncbi:MAG TPA: hypothetical protein VK730_06655 [Solirubrobacteraceae bacterium]|jgi:hypothetical protein|nr:hypothetical protein [Solirubrobacteraceae bacterium]